MDRLRWSSGSLAACLAHPSATSFPGISLCAGHHRITISTVGSPASAGLRSLSLSEGRRSVPGWAHHVSSACSSVKMWTRPSLRRLAFPLLH